MGNNNLDFFDNLSSFIDQDEPNLEEIFSEQVYIPKKCSTCKTAVVCSIVPTLVNLSKIRIHLSVETCPFNQPIKSDAQKSRKT
jgi:hypothetical protein